VTGTFGSVEFSTANSLARNPVLTYVGGNVLMTLDPGMLSPVLAPGATANQRSVAGAIDRAIGAGSALRESRRCSG